MSLPPINPSKQEHDSKVLASNNFGNIKRASRNTEGKNDKEENKLQHQSILNKLDVLNENKNVEESNFDINAKISNY